MISASDHFGQVRRRITQKARSSGVSLGRGFFALNTASCWRSAMFSMAKSERDLKAVRMSLTNPAKRRFMAGQDAAPRSQSQDVCRILHASGETFEPGSVSARFERRKSYGKGQG